MDKERRQLKRWKVSIPCTIRHKREPIRGRITDISFGGAFITELTTAPPPEKAFITVIRESTIRVVENNETESNQGINSLQVIGEGRRNG